MKLLKLRLPSALLPALVTPECRSRMSYFRVIGLIILVAPMIILMTRMIAQLCKNTMQKRASVFECLAIILVIRMIIWATNLISPIILSHHRPGHKPDLVCFKYVFSTYHMYVCTCVCIHMYLYTCMLYQCCLLGTQICLRLCTCTSFSSQLFSKSPYI